MIPVPRVSVKNSERYPSSPRAGILKRIRTMPTPGFRMSRSSARRGPSFSMTTPRYPSGQSIISSSYGSSRSPLGPSRGMIRGRLTWNSNPSRRIVSMRMPRCSSPRPDTVNVWGSSVSSTRRATFYLRGLQGELPLPSRERRVVHLEVHGDSGLLHRDAGEPLQIVGRRHRLTDFDSHQARERHDVAGRRFLYLDPLQPVERKQLHHLGLLVGRISQRTRLAQGK